MYLFTPSGFFLFTIGMYQTIGESIETAGVFRHSHFPPTVFYWHGRRYPIKKITMTSEVKDGGVRKRWYSVLASETALQNPTLFRLEYNRESEQWLVMEVWVE